MIRKQPMLLVLVWLSSLTLFADQVEMQNGDRYSGQVISVSPDSVVLQSEVVGTVKLARNKVAKVTLDHAKAPAGTVPSLAGTTNSILAAAEASTNQAAELKPFSVSPGMLQQVQKQFLSGADPAAKDTFNELISGLMSGKLSVADIRAQAQSISEEVKAHRSELGEENGLVLDSYLAILDRFLKQTSAGTNATKALPNAKAPVSAEEP